MHSNKLKVSIMRAAALLLTVFIPMSAGQTDCPSRCHCLPDPNNSKHLKITCRWPQIPLDASAPLQFVAFPTHATTSLSIECDPSAKKSLYSGRMFAVFTALTTLRIRGCTPQNVHLPPDLFEGLEHLRTLVFDQTQKIVFDKSTFSKMSQIESLTITNSNIERLPPDSMCQMANMKMLNLSSNLFSSVDAAGLSATEKCGEHLVLMDLSNNKLSYISEGTFIRMRTLHAVRLSQNDITTVQSNVFAPDSRINELWLNDNKLDQINDLPTNVRKLDVSRNQLTMMPPVLTSLTQLLQLNLSHNKIDGRGQQLINSNNLQVLDLSHNELQHLPHNIVANKTILRELYVDHNRLVELQPNAFTELSALQELSLQRNQLTSLTGIQLIGLVNLEKLNLNHNNILNVDSSAFDELPKLRKLLLKNNQLSQLPAEIAKAVDLEALDLSGNHISNLPNFVFDKLMKLRKLHLSKNNLREIQRHVLENNLRLERLDLSMNSITHLADKAFDGCPSLISINLQHNSITTMQGVFSNLPGVRVLLLDFNSLTSLDRSQLPENLQRISVTFNEIEDITSTEEHKSVLQHIDLSHNKLTQFTASSLPASIVSVNASFNDIVSIDDTAFHHCAQLAQLDVSHNQLKQIKKEAFSHTTKGANDIDLQLTTTSTMHLYLENNQLECSCHNEWLQKLTDYGSVTANIAIADMDRVYCSHVIKNEKLLLRDIERAELLCQYTEICTQDCMCCTFDGCDCKNVCPAGCRCYSDNLMATNIVQCTAVSPNRELQPKLLPMYASVIYLDGTHLSTIESHTFLGRFSLRHMYLNNSGITKIEPSAFNGLKKLQTLDLSNGQLEEWRGDELHNTAYIEHLYLHGNKLTSLGPTAFSALTHLKTLTLHDNNFQLMPQSLLNMAPQLVTMTMSENPWRCDCADRFLLQRWLMININRKKVVDAEAVYCEENLIEHANDTGALALLPASDGVTIKVNFWTFHQELNRTLCAHAEPAQVNQINAVDDMTSAVENAISRLGWITLFAVAVVLAMACFIVLIVFMIMRRSAGNNKCMGKTHKSPASLNSSATTTTTPILGHDVFITYSRADQRDVMEITSRLENEQPYYQVCLLHQHTNLNEFHQVSDEPLRMMDRAQCNIIYLSAAFLSNEWQLTQTKILLSCLKTYKKYLVIIVSPEIDLEALQLEDPLDKILRTTTRIRREDPRFWELLLEALPIRMDDSASSQGAAYSYVYGTIKPSMLV